MTADTRGVVQSFIAVLIGVVLVPVLNSVVTAANVTGTLAIVLPIIPLLFVLSIFLIQVRSMA